jgi:hypothetical protein
MNDEDGGEDLCVCSNPKSSFKLKFGKMIVEKERERKV